MPGGARQHEPRSRGVVTAGAPGGRRALTPVGTLRDALDWVDAGVAGVLQVLEGRDFDLGNGVRERLRPFIRLVIESVLRVARDRALLTPAHYEELATTCRRYDLDADLALEALHVTAEHTWRELLTSAPGSERAELLDSVERLLRLTGVLQQVVMLAYAEDGASAVRASSPRKGTIAYRGAPGRTAVVALPHEPSNGTAAGFGHRPADPATVRLRRLRNLVGHRGTVLELDDVVLLVVPGAPGFSGEADLLDEARRLVEGLTLDVPTGVAICAPGEPLSQAIAEACEVLWTVTALGHEPRTYHIEEVVLEVLLCRSPDIAHKMQRRLLPVASSGSELLGTLKEVLDGDGDRRATARALCIHPNTLAYRLRKITELTTLSVTHPPRDQMLLRVALTSMNVMRTIDEGDRDGVRRTAARPGSGR